MSHARCHLCLTIMFSAVYDLLVQVWFGLSEIQTKLAWLGLREEGQGEEGLNTDTRYTVYWHTALYTGKVTRYTVYWHTDLVLSTLAQ